MPPLFLSKNSKIAQKLRKILSNSLQFFQNTIVLLCNYLIYSKIKFFIFLSKSVAIIKKVVYLQCQTTTQ